MSPGAVVLVVDDEPEIRDLIALNIEAAGHRVHKAVDAPSALRIARDHAPDVIVLDVMLPGLDGYELLRLLKSDGSLSAVPVVMLTALDDPESRIRGGIEGALRYVTKPFTRRELVGAIEDVLGKTPLDEADARRAARADALTALARLEVGSGERRTPTLPRVRVDRLERVDEPAFSGRQLQALRSRCATLDEAQRCALVALRDANSPTHAAAHLGQTRTRYYATLRRIVQHLDLDGTPTLQAALRAGLLDV
jgi:DNA-binding response OmpR family regulator